MGNTCTVRSSRHVHIDSNDKGRSVLVQGISPRDNHQQKRRLSYATNTRAQIGDGPDSLPRQRGEQQQQQHLLRESPNAERATPIAVPLIRHTPSQSPSSTPRKDVPKRVEIVSYSLDKDRERDSRPLGRMRQRRNTTASTQSTSMTPEQIKELQRKSAMLGDVDFRLFMPSIREKATTIERWIDEIMLDDYSPNPIVPYKNLDQDLESTAPSMSGVNSPRETDSTASLGDSIKRNIFKRVGSIGTSINKISSLTQNIL